MIFHLASPPLAYCLLYAFVQLGLAVEYQQGDPNSASFRDLETEGSAVLSGHLPGLGLLASWGKFDWRY